jgi:hypothetical protein
VGIQLAETEYELWAAAPIGDPPEDRPAWSWCTLKPGGLDFLASVEAVVGADPSGQRLPDQSGSRRFSLTGNGSAALLIEDSWTEPDGDWHYRFRLRPGTNP